MIDISVIGNPWALFFAVHVGLTQIVRQQAKWRGQCIQDAAAVFLSLFLGLILGFLLLGDVATQAGIRLPYPYAGMVLGLMLAAANSGIISKFGGIQKDAARYRAQEAVKAGLAPGAEPEPESEAVGQDRALTAEEMDQMTQPDPYLTEIREIPTDDILIRQDAPVPTSISAPAAQPIQIQPAQTIRATVTLPNGGVNTPDGNLHDDPRRN